MEAVDLCAWLLAFTCVTLTSKYASCPCLQKFRALISRRAPCVVFAVRCWKNSPWRSVRWGSVETLLQHMFISPVSRSLMLTCRWLTKPPFFSVGRGWFWIDRHRHNMKGCRWWGCCIGAAGRLRNSLLDRLNPWLTRGRVVSQLPAPLSLVCLTNLSSCSGRDSSSFLTSLQYFCYTHYTAEISSMRNYIYNFCK